MIVGQIESEKVVGSVVFPIGTSTQAANDLKFGIQQRSARAAKGSDTRSPLIYFPMPGINGIVKPTKSRDCWYRCVVINVG